MFLSVPLNTHLRVTGQMEFSGTGWITKGAGRTTKFMTIRLSRVKVSSSAPQSERKAPPGALSYDQCVHTTKRNGKIHRRRLFRLGHSNVRV